MSGDTILAIIAVSLTAISSPFSPSSAIECGSGTGHHGGGRWRSEHGSAAGKTEGRSRGGGPENPGWFWSMTVNGPMTRADQSAIGLAVAVMLLITVWGWL